MKKIMIILLILVLAFVLLVGGYVAYVFIDYHRLEDNIVLSTANPYAQEKGETAPSEILRAGEEKTIVSWNIGFGAYSADFSFFMDGGTEARARSYDECMENTNAAVLKPWDEGADFVLLQEVDEKGTRSLGINQRANIEAYNPGYNSVYAQNYDSSYLFYPIHQPIGANRGGILTMANVQVESALRRSLPIEAGFNKFFDLDRCYSVSRIPVDNGKTLCLYNLHLSAYTSDGSIATEQLALLLADMQAEYDSGNYVIAGGDFNKDLWGDSSAYTGIPGANASWCQPFPTELLPEGISLVSSLDEANLVLSCRDTGAPYQKGVTFEVTLDGFMVSDNVEVLGCEVLDYGFQFSDHNPVRMNFRLMEE